MRRFHRQLLALLLIGTAACARNERQAAPEPKAAPQATVRGSNTSGRMENASALIAALFPSAKGNKFVCESPLQAGAVPEMSCHVGPDTARLLDVHIAYGASGPWVATLSGELVHTAELIALQDTNGLRYGPAGEAGVRKRLSEMQPVIETFLGRPLGEPKLIMHRVQLSLAGSKSASAIVWTATYPRGGVIDIEPIGGSVIRLEL